MPSSLSFNYFNSFPWCMSATILFCEGSQRRRAVVHENTVAVAQPGDRPEWCVHAQSTHSHCSQMHDKSPALLGVLIAKNPNCVVFSPKQYIVFSRRLGLKEPIW